MKTFIAFFLFLFSIAGHCQMIECKGDITLSLASGGSKVTPNYKVVIDQANGKFGSVIIILDGKRFEGPIEHDEGYFYSILDISRAETYLFLYTKKGKNIDMKSVIYQYGEPYLKLDGLLKCGKYSPKE
ncbi:MAG: hypothetical protein ACOVP4_10295 [Bacteriovoracaceae bacterium]